jgi:DNA-binding transcriptional LysR family regulator
MGQQPQLGLGIGQRLAQAPQVAARLGLGVGILPLFLAEPRSDLRRLSEPLEDAETELWLLTHPEARHLRRISAVYSHLAQAIVLP